MSEVTTVEGRLASYLRAVEPAVPAALVSAEAFDALRVVAQQVPPALAATTFGFECRLGDPAAWADLVAYADAGPGRDALADLAPDLLADPTWRRVRDLARTWRSPGSVLRDGVENLWLEFDLEGRATASLQAGAVPPSIFGGLPPWDQDRPQPSTYRPNVDGYLAAVTAILRALGREVSEETERCLARCFAALQRHEYLFQVGLMLTRAVDTVRLCIRLRTTSRTRDYLTAVGWPGVAGPGAGTNTPGQDALDDLLALVGPTDHTWLHLDVGHGVQPTIGLECYFAGNAQPRREPRWAALLGVLVERGLCTRAKRDALLAYPGHAGDAAGAAPWPAELVAAEELLEGRRRSTFVRTLHHLKVVLRPGGVLEAKAYLAANLHWYAPEGTRR